MQFIEFIYTFFASFLTLFPVTNPIGNAFIVNGFMHGLDNKDKKRLIKKIVLYCFLIGIGTLILGRFVLLLFGLNIAIIQLGGGLVICRTSFLMLSGGDTNENKKLKEESSMTLKDNLQNQLFYPISFPLIMGAGSISVILTMMATASNEANLLGTLINYGLIGLVIFAICIVLYLSMTQTQFILKRLGKSGHTIINKLIAFITFCIGLQITVTGLSKVFHLNIL